MVSSPQAAAQALVTIDVASQLLENTNSPGLGDHTSHKWLGPFARLSNAPHLLADAKANAEALDELLGASAYSHDSHPSLADRLKALGADPPIPSPPDPSAAVSFLGPQMATIASRLDEAWEREHGQEWREQHNEVRRAVDRLAELDARLMADEQSSLERGRLLETLQRDGEALEAYKVALSCNQKNGQAAFAVGRLLLLSEEDSEGVDLLLRSMDLDASLVPAACEILIDHFSSKGRFVDAERCRARLVRHKTRTKLLEDERTKLTAIDRLAPHGLGEGELETVIGTLRREPAILAGFLVRKDLRYSPGSQLTLGARGSGFAPRPIGTSPRYFGDYSRS